MASISQALFEKAVESIIPGLVDMVHKKILGTPTPPPAAAGKKDQWTKTPGTGRNDHIQEAEIVE